MTRSTATRPVNRAELVNGAIFIVVAAISLIEAHSLSLDTRASLLTQRLGPGVYLYLLGGVLLINGVLHVLKNVRAGAEGGGGVVSPSRVLTVTLVIALYALLIERFGYAVASFVFFVAIYWLLGVRRWIANLPLSLVTAATFYFVFVRLFQLVFPPGEWVNPFV